MLIVLTQAHVYLAYGQLMEQRGLIDMAMGAYERALQRDTALVDARIRLANLFQAAGDAERALQVPCLFTH